MSTTTRSRRAAHGVTTPAPKNPTTTITGTFRAHPRGFGFITLDTPLFAGGTEHTSAFVPPPLTRRLLTDDHVTAEVDLSDGRSTATGVRVLTRVRSTVFGRIERNGPKLVIAVDPNIATTKLPVSDPAAKVGTWVLYDMVDNAVKETWTTFGPAAARAMVFARAMVPTSHDHPVIVEAGKLAKAAQRSLSAPVPANRRDLRDLHTVTIDGPTSKDLDDAISAFRDKAGNLRVLVHVADVAAHVAPGSFVDLAAYETATSIYLPSWNRPMLPRDLSEAALSLLPGVDRDAVTVAYTVTATGHVEDVEVFLSRIRSDAQLTYEATSRHLAGEATVLSAQDAATLKAAAQAADQISLEREARNGNRQAYSQGRELSIAVSDPDYAKARFTQVPTEEDWSTQMLIERLMVAANESVAQWLDVRNLPGAFRTHGAPGADLAADLAAFIEMLPRDQRSPLKSTTTYEMVAEATERAGAGTGPSSLLMRNLDRAEYVAKAGHHFGLDSVGYVHFTSPLRRYADLFVHRVVHAHLNGDIATLAELAATASAVCAHLTDRTATAGRTEAAFVRSGQAVVSTNTASTSGRITEFTAKGAVVAVAATGISGVLPYETLKGNWRTHPRRVGATEHGTGNTLVLGAQVRVRVAGTDPVSGSVTWARAARRR